MTPAEIQAWIGFRFSEWAILHFRDGDPRIFTDYLRDMDGADLYDWARTFWLLTANGGERMSPE